MAAGFLGALTGLGGGVVIVPFLTLALGVDIRYAIGASLVSVIATSSGAAAAYVKEGHQHPHRDVPGDRHHALRPGRGVLGGGHARRNVAVIFGLVCWRRPISRGGESRADQAESGKRTED